MASGTSLLDGQVVLLSFPMLTKQSDGLTGGFDDGPFWKGCVAREISQLVG